MENLGKTGYAICTNCGCNQFSVNIYCCPSCRKMYCRKCLQDAVTCLNSKCRAASLEHKGYIHPFDETE